MNVVELSIIIPTLNRYEDLKNTLRDLDAQDFQDYEVLLIDQSDDTTFQRLQVSDKILHIRESVKSASRARNIGLKRASGKYVLFLDDDVIIENRSYLRSIIQNYTKKGAVGVVGPIIEHRNPITRIDRHAWSYNKSWGWLFFPRNYGKECMINDGGAGNLSVLRKNAIEIGGMDEQFIKGAHREESDFNQRYTRKFGWYHFDPNCALVHIGRREGGVRTWDTVRSKAVKAQHHYDGSWYFLFKNVNLLHWPAHILSMKVFFLMRKELFLRPDWMLISIWRWFFGFANGLVKLGQGPIYLSK